MTKKITFGFLSLIFSLAAIAAPTKATDISVGALNTAIDSVLQPLQNAFTQATVKFEKIELSKERTLAFKATGLYSKSGSRGEFAIVADEISYDYDKLVNPLTVIKGAIKGDLRLIMDTEEINGLLQGLEKSITEYAGQLTKRYGSAATITAIVENKALDDKGNITSLDGKIEVELEFSKLPNDVKIEDEMWRSISAKFKVSVKEGIALDARIISNPKHIGFAKDQIGLKEYLTKLLDQDPDLLAQLGMFISYLDSYAADIVK